MSQSGIELVYELSPMQQAMLFSSLHAPGSGVYVVQLRLRLSGRLDVEAFERAWRFVVDRHAVLRTGFYWEDAEKPLQVVYRQVDLEIRRESWRGLDAAAQEERLQAFLDADRERGFDLAEPPLLRLALFDLGPGSWQLVWTQHHILTDGWSQGLLLKELFTCYETFAQGRPPALGPARSYREHIAWLQRQDPAKAEAFWRASLAGLAQPTLLAGGDGRASRQAGFRDTRKWRRRLPAATTAALHEMARYGRFTLNTLIQGAWALVLAHTRGRGDVVFGSTVAGRPPHLPGVESIVGLFINTLPVRAQVDPERRLLAWLGELQERQVAARDFEHAPLFEIQTWSELPAGVALFDNILVFESYPLDSALASLLSDLSISDAAANELTSYPVILVVFPGAELALDLAYDANRVEASAAARLLERLDGLLLHFAAGPGPETTLGDLPVLLAGERQQVLVEWNDTESGTPREAILPELFAAVAAAAPEAPAVVAADGEVWSYRRLDAAAHHLARHLAELGIAPGARVGVAMERSADLVVALLAILRAGAAYVPLDPAYPDDRLAFMLDDAGVGVVVVQEETRDRFAAFPSLRLVCPDRNPSGSAPFAPPRLPAQALAYVIYTSGSTGRPKGVAVSHQAIVRLVRETDYAQLAPGDRVAHLSNTSFDAATFEVWAALLNGATIVVVPREVALSPAELGALLRRERVTAMFLTTALFNQMVREAPGAFDPLRRVLFGGEAADPGLVARALEQAGPERLLHVYGPTESTTFATWHQVREVAPGATTVPIGLPLANTTAYVLDVWGRPAPSGTAGELFLGGAGLAWGYLDRPDLTAERFVPDAWSGVPGARLYRTGDLVAHRLDGALEFQGRIDQQVKIRGFRIEPGEVEAVLAGHPGVRDAVVLAREDGAGERRLVGWVVLHPTDRTDLASLASWLRERLPDYMVPTAWVILPELPLTPNGKVDRRALPDPEAGGAEDFEAPSDPIEELLAGLWAEVLGLDRVGVHDDFFSLGGHSLRATQVMSRMQGLLGVELPLRNLFEAPTVAGLARAVRAARQETSAQAPPLVPVPRTDDLPASFAQQRLWFFDQLEPGSSAYNIPAAVRLTGELSLERLERIFSEVVRRHEALRTTFEDRGGRPVQVIGPPTVQRPAFVDMSHLPAEEREALARRLAVDEARRPFDLRKGPLLRLGLVRLGAEDHLLLMTLHHIVSDGWSMGVLLREIAALHEAFAADRPSPLPELPVQYADFAVWQRGWLTGEVLQTQIDAWKRQLEGAPHVLELPTDRPRPPVPSGIGKARPVALPAPLSAAVRALCRREGATPFMVLLAAWATLIGRAAGQEDLLIGTPIAGRNRREIEELIGFFVNTLVMRVRLAPTEAPSFLDLVGSVRQVALDAYAHQDLPFERLVEELAPERDLSRPPLFQVLFALQNAFGATREIPGLTLRPLMVYDLDSKFDLALTLSETPEGLSGYLEHNTELFDGSTVVRLLARFEVLLEAATADPEAPLSGLPALLEGERQQVLLEWNDTARPLPREASLHGLFERRARERPEAPAVLFDGGAWSFAELDGKADALALRLRRLGVGPEVLVGVLAAGRPELALAMLAVLKAGGAFLPLDPSWPVARRTTLLEDAAARVLLGCRDGAPAEGVPPECTVVLLEEESGPIGRIGPIHPISPTTPEQTAYLIYTSGSTGRPKGVAVGHGAAVGFALEMAAACGLADGERFLQFASPGFDVLIEEVFPVWSQGGAVVFAPQEELLTPTGLERVLNRQGVTALELPTPYWHEWVDDLDRRAAAPPAALRRLLVGGEKASLERLEKWRRHSVPLVHVFGLTETTVTSTIHLWDGAAPPARDLPIGRPVGNTWLYVLDRGGAPVPCGIPGELYIGGSGVGRGYLGRPELTAERFVPDPLGGAGSAGPGARIYRTGDLARYRADGTLDFLGRIDEQVKIRGFRVEPGEITVALEQNPAVSEAFVAVREVRPGDRRLVAWVVPAPGCTVSLEALRAQVGERLPDYMVPTEVVEMPALPRTVNGKIDRRALPDPDPALRPAAGEAPRTPVEELLAAIWCAALGLPSAGRDEDFFALGGHSLLATQVMSRIRAVLGVDLPLRVLFESPTIAALAGVVQETRQDAVAALPLVPLPRTAAPPLSFAQQRLWLVDQLEPGSVAYNLASPVRIEGAVAPGLLERIFRKIVRRHEVLRTGFALRPGGPVQEIAPPGDPAAQPHLWLIDLSQLPPASREEEALRLVHAEARLPFDLRRAPLLRLTLVRLAEPRHLLLMTMHHIVSDGWSASVLVREIAALYVAFSQGRPSPLPELPVQYADFAVWQRNWLRDEVLEAQLAFWRRRLAGAPAVLELATDRPRSARSAHRGGTRSVALSPALSAAVRELCGRQGVTAFMTLLAAWAVLLGRHAGQDDVVVGAPIAGRNREEIEDLIGFFVNTLALRIRWAPDGAGKAASSPPFAELLSRVRLETLDAFAHQDLPFERLVEELVPERDLGHSPVFQVLLALQNVPPIHLALPGLSLEELDVSSGTAKLELTLSLGERASGFAGALEYDADLFDATTAERLLDRFATFLEAVAGDPGLPVAEVPLLRPAERHQAQVEWNDTRSEYPREPSLPALFAAVARELPQEPAIVAGIGGRGEVWTFHRLDEASSRLARHLQSLGVAAETAVGLAMERSPELIVGALAILKAGGFYVPLDASYPDERLAFMLADTGARTVLVHERTKGRMESLGDLRLVEAHLWAEGSPHPPHPGGKERRTAGERLPSESLAYVIYTSGSTGRPKGVAVSHRAVVRLVRSTNYVRLGPGNRTGHVANVSFDAATYEIWGALLNGAAAAVIPREVVVSPLDFAAALREQRVTSMFLTSALFTKMSREAPDAFATLNELLVGGEAVDPVAARTVLAGRPPRRLLNGYGPTESTTFAAWHPIRDVPDGAAGVPIGRPLANTTLWVLDPWQAAVPTGAAGELCIGGDGLARGYLHRPELTAERFVPHPWAAGERLYRTGDLVRQRADGALLYLGRLDEQVKIRGFRIEPGEIEAVLADHPAVRACAVLARRDGPGDASLAAYVVLDPTDPTDHQTDSSLRAWLLERLPDFMIPSAWVFLEALPLTANGKLDRRALPAPGTGREVGQGYVPPADSLEEKLAAIWAEVLQRERVGVLDDFFALGGHSLLATQVVTRVRETLGVELPLRRIFEEPTIRGLAGHLRQAPQDTARAPVRMMESGGEEPPLSFAQQRLWLIDQLEPGNPAYNIHLAVRLTSELSVEALEQTFQEIVRRHETLRTTFALRAGQPVQVIAAPDDAGPELLTLDLSLVPAEARDEWARELALEEARHPFDLQTGPLLRLGLLRLDAGEHLLLITLHHVIADGWSMNVLLREIGILYPALLRGEPAALPALPLQYADFARWQRGWLTERLLEHQLAWWQGKLAGAPALLELPTDRPRPPVDTHAGGALDLALPVSLSTALQELCRRHDATPFMALLAAWAVLLGRHAHQEDVLIGTPIAGRNRREIEDLIGCFVNTLVLRTDLSIRQEGPSFQEILGQVRATALEAFTHQDLPFERIVEALVTERHLAYAPLVQVFFALQNAPGMTLEVSGLSFAPFDLHSGIVKFDLFLALWEQGATFAGALEYKTDLFDRSTAERFLGRFRNLLAAAIEAPRRAIADLPLMLPEERQQTLLEWNDTERPDAAAPGAGLCLHELFAAQAVRTPEAVALVHGRERLTYGELAARAGGMAHRLRALGIGPETRVAVCLERSPALVATLLGTLAAGGAYVPIDPAYPAERRGWTLEDSGAAVLVTRGRLTPDLQEISQRGRRGVQGIDLDAEEIPQASGLPSGTGAAPEHLAYVIYTSGSTGDPKGVAIEHRSAVLLAGWARQEFSDGELAGVLAGTSVCFDLSVFEIFVPLAWGGRVILADDVLELPGLPAEAEVRLVNTVPSAAAGLLRSGSLPASVRTVNLAGEPLPAGLAERLYATGTVERVFNLYGPSEDTTYSTGALVPRAAARPPAIGRPLPGTRACLVDPRGAPVPPGVPGELWLAGTGLARGYLDRPELTAERFTPDPFAVRPGGRVYRTGDLVRSRPDGELEFLGRIDHQVKVRGFRIELGEIEAALRSHPAVEDCVVQVREASGGSRLLVAYVAGAAGALPAPAALRAFLGDKLPDYMIPSDFVALQALPRTPNGKVDRKALPLPGQPADGTAPVAPRDPLEEALTAIWREILRRDGFGVHDNFFTIGGHSLLATQVMARVREVLGIEVPLRRLYAAPTIAQLAQTLRG